MSQETTALAIAAHYDTSLTNVKRANGKDQA